MGGAKNTSTDAVFSGMNTHMAYKHMCEKNCGIPTYEKLLRYII